MSETQEVRPHAEISSSKIAIQLKCSGSIVLGRSLPPKEATDAMLSGTKTHEISEIGLEDYLQHRITGSDPEVRLSKLLTDDPEREERVRGYIEAVFEKALQGSITKKMYKIEDKVTLHEEFNIFGYADFWAVYKDDRAKRAAIIVDLKDGREIVKAKTDQLKFLASGLLEDFRREGIELDYVRAAIYQPKAIESERYSEVKYSAKQLDAFKSKVLKLAENVYIKRKYKFKTGSHCRYCKCQELCPEYGKSLANKTSLKLLDVGAITFPEPEKISDEVLKNIVLHEKSLIDFVKACKKYAMARYISGQTIAGLKLVEGKGKRSIDATKIEEIKAFFSTKGIVAVKEKLKGITELSNELKAKKFNKNLVDSFCSLPSKPLKLVDETDERPAVQNALDLLKEQNEDEEEDD